mgnify:CR=1 FL=1
MATTPLVAPLVLATVSASWSELTPPSPAIALDGSDTLTASFTAPPAVGGDQQRRFRLEVRSPPLCTGGPPTCLSAAAETSVIITDRAGPIGRLVGTQPFNHAAPVVLEIGSGTGTSTLAMAHAEPDLSEIARIAASLLPGLMPEPTLLPLNSSSRTSPLE